MQRALARLERLHEIGIALSAESDTNRLLENILLGAKKLTAADAGTLDRLEDGRLHFETVRNDSLGLTLGGATGKPAGFGPVPLHGEDGSPNPHNVAACVALQGSCSIFPTRTRRPTSTSPAPAPWTGAPVTDPVPSHRAP